MNCSAQGRALIRKSEGCVLSIYKDSGGVLTGGFGHTGPGLHYGEPVSVAQADAWFEDDVAEAEKAVNRLAHNCTQGQFDALTDFVFNLGARMLEHSTLLRMHNAGNHHGAAEQFGRWVYCKGKVLPGLVKRRAAEAVMYLA